MLRNFLLSLDSDVSKEADASEPIWTILIVFCAIILSLTSIATFFLFGLQTHFRKMLGPITLLSAISNICLACCWFVSFLTSLVDKSLGPYAAFATLFCLYASVFNKMGFTWYYYCYLKDKTPLIPLQSIQIINARNRPNDPQEQKFEFVETHDQVPLMSSKELPGVPPELIKVHDKLVQSCDKIQSGYNRTVENDKKIIKRLKKLEELIKGSPLSQINKTIIACVLIAAFFVTVTAAFFKALGKGFFEDWSIEWKKETQTLGVIIYCFVAGFDVFMSFLTVNFYYREGISTNLPELENLEDNDRKQKKHYLSYCYHFIISMTFLNCLFLAANVYANQVTEKGSWYGFWKASYFLSPALQSLSIFLLKITEQK